MKIVNETISLIFLKEDAKERDISIDDSVVSIDVWDDVELKIMAKNSVFRITMLQDSKIKLTIVEDSNVQIIAQSSTNIYASTYDTSILDLRIAGKSTAIVNQFDQSNIFIYASGKSFVTSTAFIEKNLHLSLLNKAKHERAK